MFKRIFAVALTAATISAGATALPAQAAAPVKCDGTLSGTIDSSVVVPSGADCVLDGATVNGGVRVKPGGSLLAIDSEISRNVLSQGADRVRLRTTNVARNIHIFDTAGNVNIGSEGCPDPTVGNNLMVDDTGGAVRICNVQARNNIKVTDTGKSATVLNSCAGNNIFVNRTTDTARVRNSVFGNHIFMRNNGDNVRANNTKAREKCGL